MLGNAELRKIEKMMLEGNFEEAKRLAKELLKDYLEKKQRKPHKYDASPKTKKFAFILEKLFPQVSSVRKSSEAYAKEILLTV
jgi:hypothetical protein